MDVIDGGGMRISRLFQAQWFRRWSGPNRVVECPFWAVVRGKAGVQPWVVSVVPFVQVRPPSKHNRLLLCTLDALGQLQRWKQCEWSDVRAIAPAPHLKQAAQAFLLRFQKQLPGKGPKGEKGGKAGSDASGDPTLQSKGRTEKQARGSRRPRPTTTPQEAAQAAQAARDGGGGGQGRRRRFSAWRRRTTEGSAGRPQDGAGGAHRRARRVGAAGEWLGKGEGGVAAIVRHGAGACRLGGGGQRVAPTPTMCCTCRPRRFSCTLHSAPNSMWPSTWGSKRPPSRR